MELLKPYHQDEHAAREHLEKLLWPDGPGCPRCGVSGEATQSKPKKGTQTHGRKGLYQCNGCREQFTVTLKTIFEDSLFSGQKQSTIADLPAVTFRSFIINLRPLILWAFRQHVFEVDDLLVVIRNNQGVGSYFAAISTT